MAKARKRKPPSRVRYEENNPVISCRVTMDVYKWLEEIKEDKGMSFADILKVGLGLLEPQAKKDRTARNLGRKEGYREGYADAEKQFKVAYPCNWCGRLITVYGEQHKKTVSDAMRQRIPSCMECYQERQNSRPWPIY